MTLMFDLTGFQRDLLYVIAGLDHPSGQQIKERLGEDRNDITPGRLYPNLDTLVDRDFIEKGAQNRRKNYYQITASIMSDSMPWASRPANAASRSTRSSPA